MLEPADPAKHDQQAAPRLAQVARFNGVTKLDLEASVVLANAPKLTAVVILGYDGNGDEYFASSLADGADVLWLLERLKLRLLNTNTLNTDASA
ncbi:MAG: hypothetical protein ACREVG_07690 [Burkholderiales bacterium]